MEANKADWDALFEPYPFFESYKNYLRIDISAENVDDLRNWKGWVKSRLRQLTLKVYSNLSFPLCSFIYFICLLCLFLFYFLKKSWGVLIFSPLFLVYIHNLIWLSFEHLD